MNAGRRQEAIEKLARGGTWDVLVVGGGVTGAGVALDAASRGLRTAIIEAQDWAAGTSSKSTKLAHGGLRYLKMFDFGLVHEALAERNRLLLTTAPYMVRALPFLYLMRHGVWERAFVGAGIGLYDLLAMMSRQHAAVPRHRQISKRRLHERFPDLRPDAVTGAVQYWDAQVDDARLVWTLVRTAMQHGALAVSRTQMTSLVRRPDGSVHGVRAVDLETGAAVEIGSRVVINATGVWTGRTEALVGADRDPLVLPAKGVHIVVPRSRIRGDGGLIVPTEKSVLLVVPWRDYWIIGTTDTAYTGSLRDPVATKTDVDYLLDHVNRWLARPLVRADIIGVYAGLRPLVATAHTDSRRPAKVSRRHKVISPVPGLVIAAGGKLTSYRVMAKDAVDAALGDDAATRRCVTDHLPLSGVVELAEATGKLQERGPKLGWAEPVIAHLRRRYGANVLEVMQLVEQQPDLARPLAGAEAYLRAEIAYAAHNEMVLHLEDILLRRTRLEYEVADGGLAAIPEILEIVAPILGWDAARCAREQEAYRHRREAEAAAGQAQTDGEAGKTRAAAGDVCPMYELPGRMPTNARKVA